MNLEETFKEHLIKWETTESIGRYSQLQQVKNELDEVFKSCSEDNWDGYGAIAIAEETILEAKNIINMLNATFLNFPIPEITPEPNGDIAFEWSDEYDRTFVLSIAGDQTLNYAGIFGLNKTHGCEILGDFIPDSIITHLKRLYSK